MSPSRIARLPALLVAGLIATAIADAVVPIASHLAMSGEPALGDVGWLRLTLLAWAVDLVALLALVRGTMALRDGLAGRARRSAAVAAVAFAACALAQIAVVTGGLVLSGPGNELLSTAAQVARLGGFAGLIAATLDRSDPRSALLTLAAAAIAALGWPLSPLHQAAMAAAVGEPSPSRTVYLVAVGIGLELLVLAMMTGAVGRDRLSEIRTEAGAAARGLHRASSGLAARVVVMAIAVPAAIAVPGVGLSLFAMVVAAAAASAAIAIGAARASHGAPDPAPARRLAVAAIAIGAGAAFQLGLAASMLAGPATADDERHAVAVVADLILLIPAVDLAGMLVLVSALAATARHAAVDGVARRLPVAAIALILCAGAATWLLDGAAHGDAGGTWIAIAVGIVAAIATAVIAHAARLLAATAHRPRAVPTATAQRRAGA